MRALDAVFAESLARLGPFEPSARFAAAVSGGADSSALALLARDWVRQRDGHLLALIVDHGLRPESSDEARLVAQRMTTLGIEARILPLHDLPHGPSLAERARESRYRVLIEACRSLGIRHLLLGHHAGDQVETVAMRVLRGSRNDGLAGMAASRAVEGVCLLRPLLGVHPSALRGLLIERNIPWVEDPSNTDRRALRPRLRQGLAPRMWSPLLRAIAAAGERRQREEAAIATDLAGQVTLYPEGYALLRSGRPRPGVMSAVVGAVGGLDFPPDPDRVAELAAHPAPATLHGVRIMPAGRLGDGWLIVREEAAVQPPIQAAAETVWDRRFRLSIRPNTPEGAEIGALGDDAAAFRRLSPLPSVVLRVLPALRLGKKVAAVPHLGYGTGSDDLKMMVTFAPPRPAGRSVFVPAEPLFGTWDDVAVQYSGCGVGVHGPDPDTIYVGDASRPPNQNQPWYALPIEDVSKDT
jgi:tRNA(Ile)-lysidine synthase